MNAISDEIGSVDFGFSTCEKCGHTVYTRSDGTEMVRLFRHETDNGVYWYDDIHDLMNCSIARMSLDKR